MARLTGLFRRFGPGLITASLVLGPGSIVASSRAGAQSAYRLLWVLVLASVLMAAFTAMGARLGCALQRTPLTHLAQWGVDAQGLGRQRRAGRWLAGLAGLSAFVVTAGFQFGNNLGVAFAARGLIGGPAWVWPLLFTGLALGFLAGARQIYKWLERIMVTLVGVMILAFFANLLWTGFALRGVAAGLVPRLGEGDFQVAAAMLATTFSAVAAFYQAYLVQAKGWSRAHLGDAIRDAWAGIFILAGIAAVILVGSAESLYGREQDFADVGQLAAQLKGILGPAANLVFCAGLGAASFSSFIVNALIGGHLLADGLGLEARIDSRSTRFLAAGVMLVGCAVAVGTFRLGWGTTTSLLLAQAFTLVAAPLCAILLVVLTNRASLMGDLRNRLGSNVLGAVGLAVIVALNMLGLIKLLKSIGLV